MNSPETLAESLRRNASRLREAGLSSPDPDLRLLAGHLLDLSPGQVAAAALTGRPAPAGLDALVTRRLAGEPVQHLTGTAGFAGHDVLVGPGVFVPRPETELLVEAALLDVAQIPRPRIVDLCTGSGALALTLARALPTAGVWAVELDDAALEWATRNLAGTGVVLVPGDATDLGGPGRPLPELDGTVDVVVVNPPYIPDGDPLGSDAAADPALALFGGPDGTDIPLAVASRAAHLLRPGGTLLLEHDERHQDRLVAALAATGAWAEVEGRPDLSGRPRYLRARAGARLAR